MHQISTRAKALFDQMLKSGESEATYVIHALLEIASNPDPEMATDEHLALCAEEIAATATHIAEHLKTPTTENGPTGEIIFLTNALFENTDKVSEAHFNVLGLEHGTFNGAFYPLTDAESKYLIDQIETKKHSLLGGYSVLHRNRKWFAPSLELPYKTDNTSELSLPSRLTVAVEILTLREHLKNHIKDTQGAAYLVLDDFLHDRHTLTLLLPTEIVIERFPDPQAYWDWIKQGFDEVG